MGQVLHLISDIPVSVNHYVKPRGFVTWKGKQPIANVSMYETAEAKAYKKKFKKHVQEQVKLQGYSLTPNKTQHFYIDCVFYFDRVDKDPNNYFKLLLDSITETQLIWIDDNVTCERVNAIYYDTNDPRIEITIKPVDYIGIFPSQSELDKFEGNCKSCTRFKRNCSLFSKAKEGRVIDEICDCKCNKYKPLKKEKNQNED